MYGFGAVAMVRYCEVSCPLVLGAFMTAAALLIRNDVELLRDDVVLIRDDVELVRDVRRRVNSE